jgi:hypothetical protein
MNIYKYIHKQVEMGVEAKVREIVLFGSKKLVGWQSYYNLNLTIIQLLTSNLVIHPV